MTPPRVPADGDGRMKARSSAASAAMRVLSAQDRPAGDHARRIDRQHTDPVAGASEPGAEGVYERRLARAGHAADAHPVGAARVGQQMRQQLLGGAAVVGPSRLHQRDSPAHSSTVARPHPGHQPGFTLDAHANAAPLTIFRS